LWAHFKKRGYRDERADISFMREVQEKELYDKQEQEEHTLEAGIQEILPLVREAHGPQGKQHQISTSRTYRHALACKKPDLIQRRFIHIFVFSHRPVAPTGRAPVSKTGCCGFESCLACIQKEFNG
jgi:hypothetical protein